MSITVLLGRVFRRSEVTADDSRRIIKKSYSNYGWTYRVGISEGFIHCPRSGVEDFHHSRIVRCSQVVPFGVYR